MALYDKKFAQDLVETLDVVMKAEMLDQRWNNLIHSMSKDKIKKMTIQRKEKLLEDFKDEFMRLLNKYELNGHFIESVEAQSMKRGEDGKLVDTLVYGFNNYKKHGKFFFYQEDDETWVAAGTFYYNDDEDSAKLRRGFSQISPKCRLEFTVYDSEEE